MVSTILDKIMWWMKQEADSAVYFGNNCKANLR